MTAVNSTMLPLGTAVPDFTLPDTNNGNNPASISKTAEGGRAFLVLFLANHCPYVKHILEELTAVIKEYQHKGLKTVAISSTDISGYPDDSPEEMTRLAREQGWNFPYLYDETQEAAHAYQAACTPDIYLFDSEKRMAYRGQFDDSRPKNDKPVTGRDLREAIEAVLAGKTIPEANQTPSIGCNIKWKPGNEPDWF